MIFVRKPGYAPRVPTKKESKGAVAEAAVAAIDGEGFRDAGKGFALGLRDGKLVCRNAKGKILAQVPKDLKESEAAEDLLALRDFLQGHEEECRATVEGWMLRSVPTSLALVAAVWADEAWRKLLENAVVVPMEDKAGKGGAKPDLSRAGFLKGVDEKKGLGLVDADGETSWQKAPSFLLPHPILLENLDDLRALGADLGITQGLVQLFREVFVKPKTLTPGQETIEEYRGGRFEQLTHARGAAKSLGYRTSGSWVVTRVYEDGNTVQARFWLEGDAPDGEAFTDALGWADEAGKPIPISDVPPIAFSEGMRMASALYGKRVIEKENADG